MTFFLFCLIIVSNETVGGSMKRSLPNEWFLFSSLNEEERKAAKSILSYDETCYKSGDTVLEKGETAHSLGYIAEGCVAVYRDTAQKSVLLNKLSRGSSFGASSLFGQNEAFPTHLVAKASTRIFFIPQKTLETLFTELPQTAINYISFLSDRIRFLNGKIRSFASGTNEEKLARFFLENEENGRLSLKNLSSLASSLSLGRASLYRVIDAFTERGVIARDKNTITVINKEELERMTKL